MKKKYGLLKENMLSSQVKELFLILCWLYLTGLVVQSLKGKLYRTEELFCVRDSPFLSWKCFKLKPYEIQNRQLIQN